MQVAVGSPGSPSPTSCRIQLLGGLRVTLAGPDVAPAFPRKIGALLAYLACFLHRSHSREALIELFWPEVDLEAGRASLRNALPLLRRLLEPAGVTPGSLLLADRQTVRLDPQRVSTDVEEFERELQAAARAASPSEQVVLLERALAGYGGELLPGYYEPWVLTERERLAAAYVAALRQLAAARAQQGDVAGAIEAARRAVQVDPLEEEAHFDLIRHQAAAGQTAAARRQYLELERLLKAELEVTPSQSLADLLTAGERSRGAAPPAPASSRSPDLAPPAPRLTVPLLPAPLTSFFGREEEIARVRALLEGGPGPGPPGGAPPARLVTFTGPGGTGKTRLALQVAADLLEAFTDGVFFVDLAPIREPGLVPSAIAQTLGVGETGGQPLLETLKSFMRAKSLLLVLDNFEQVLDAGPTVAELLAAAPWLKVLVTSRAALRLRGEKEFPVLPLALPPVGAPLVSALSASGGHPQGAPLQHYAAVALFVQRALDVQPDFAVTSENAPVVGKICHRLDGLPLALELAAARLKLFSPEALLSRLENRLTLLTGGARDLPARQQTLRGTIGWSYDLLSERERALFRRLSVFVGGCTLEAVESIVRAEDDHHPLRGYPIDVLDGVASLVDKNLLRPGEEVAGTPRFTMLETVREYGRECLERDPQDAAAATERHAHFYLEWVEDLKRTARGRGNVHQEAGFDQIEAEYGNIRAALAWSCAASGAEGESDAARREVGLRLAAALRGFWIVRCLFSDARRFLERLLAQPREGVPTAAWAGVLLAAGTLAYIGGDGSSARSLLTQSLSAAREVKEAEVVIGSLLYLGHLLRADGDIVGARGLFEESLVVAQETGNAGDIAWSLNSLGVVVSDQGDYSVAWGYFERSLALAREIGEKGGVGWSLLNLADTARLLKDHARAGRLYRESLSCFQQIGSQRELALALEGLARLFSEKGRPRRAAQLLASAELLREAIGCPIAPAHRGAYDAHVTAVRTALGEEAFIAAWAEGRAMAMEEAIEYALQDEEQPPPPSPVSPERLPFPTPLPLSPVPVPLTPFFGREEEIAQVCAMLESASTRLVTLTGLGGTGKTRLALEVARRLQQEGSDWAGVAFVSLVDLTDPRLLLQTLRGALNLPAAGDTDPLEQIATYFAGERFLLVLDNFEQLLDAGEPRFGRGADSGGGRAPGPGTVEQLLESVPRLVCLVTSRRPLGLTAEADYLVPPLPTPAAPALPERLLEFASVRLFLNRAQAVRPEFQVTAANAEAVTRLCQALEGIPLALELAAARSPVLTPAQMLQHLSDRFGFLVARHRGVAERHRTLRAALEWSYQALPEEQQRLLARLSVFRGGWTLEAAEAVCGDQGAPPRSGGPGRPGVEGAGSDLTATPERPAPLLDQLLELRNAALIIAEEAGEAMRFRMLDTVRDYSEERLAEWGEAEAVRQGHLDWYLGLAEQADRVFEGYGGPEQAAWLDRLDTEHDNLRAALAWCLADESGAERGLRLATALVQFWEVRGYVSEGRSYLAEALGQEVGEERFDRESSQRQGRVLGPPGGGLSAPPGRDTGPGGRPTPERAKALSGAAVLAWMQGDVGAARALLEESLAVSRELGAGVEIAWSIHQLGHLASNQGDYEMAQGLYEESLAMFREVRHPSGIATSLAEQGNVALKQGDHDAARSSYEESLAISRELGHQVNIAVALNNLGKIAREQGDLRSARALHVESLEIRRALGDKGGFPWSLEAFAQLAALVDLERAAKLWGAAEVLRNSLGLPLRPNERPEYDRSVAGVREALGQEAFTKAWAAGQEMPMEEAIRYALETDDA